MAVKVIVPPAVEPITLEEAKAHLRVIGSDDDVYILSLITAARVMAENKVRRALVPQTLQAGFDSWGGVLRLPRPPLIEVEAVSYIDPAGAPQTLLPTAYAVNDYTEPASIAAAPGTTWPEVQARAGAVTVRYRAGYAVTPAPLVAWMKLMIGSMYQNRETIVNGVSVNLLPDQYTAWHLQPYMVYE